MPSKFQGATVLCIGAGLEQLPMIQLAQQMGLRVIAVDGNSQAVGLTIANRGVWMDLRDSQGVIQLARAERVRAVLPVPLGAILTTVGAVNDALGLCGISEQAARFCTDKTLTHRQLSATGLSTSPQILAADVAEIQAAVAEIGFPVVLKPRFGSGSLGVFVARTWSELQCYLPWHLQQRSSQQTLVEGFILGRELGIDGVMVGEQAQMLLIRDKEVTELPFRLPYAYLAPANLGSGKLLSDRLLDPASITTTLAQAASALGLQNCLVHADLILDQDGTAHVIDISGRPSGFNLSAKLVPAAIDVHPIQQAILLSLGEPADFHPKAQRGAVLRMLAAPTGRLQAVAGLEQARAAAGVIAVDCFLQPGDMIRERRSGAAGYSVGYLLTAAATRDEADLLWQQAAQLIQFQVDPNP